MFAFSSPRPLVYDTRHGRRRIPAASPQDAAGGLDPHSVVLAIHDEDAVASAALSALRHPDEPPMALQRYSEWDLIAWPAFPRRLGRLDTALAVIVEPAPLSNQLADLRASSAGRRHVRVALVGGFGYNLGDAILGATAWRSVLPVLRDTLGSVSADALLGPMASPAVGEILAAEDGVDRALFTPPSLAEFARYDAFFDFSGLVTLPKFHEGPALDWILWWAGLDPETVPASAKRNSLRLPESAISWAECRLAAAPGTCIHLGWRASVPLRSMPDDEARRLGADLLALVPELTLVTDCALGLDHPRILDLGSEVDSPDRLMALVTACDGHLGIDSLPAHAADSADVPAVMLAATLPPSRFPYYPNMRVLNPPGVELLPGWGRTKIADELWDQSSESYRRAWGAISAYDCWAALADRMALRPPPARRATVLPATPPFHGQGPIPRVGVAFPRDVSRPLNSWLDGEMERFAAAALRPGCIATLLGAQGDLPLALLRRVSPGGELHVLEPRRLRAQALAAAAQAHGLDVLHPWAAGAASAAGRLTIAGFDPRSEADPAAWGNLPHSVSVPAMALDDLGLRACDAIVLRPPHDLSAAMDGAGDLLRRARPLVLAGPLPEGARSTTRQILVGSGYHGWVCRPGQGTGGTLLVAAPAEAGARFQGFDPI